MERRVGTISRGIRCPIIREGDNLVDITVDSVLAAAESEGFELRNRDVIGITESIVARAQGNYASVDDIAAEVFLSPTYMCLVFKKETGMTPSEYLGRTT